MSEQTGFRADLGRAARAWSLEPKIVAISAALGLVASAPDPWSWLLLPAFLFSIGWQGTQLMFYLRAYRGLPILSGELWRFTWSFLGRFFVLGLVASMPLLAALVTYVLVTGRTDAAATILTFGGAAVTAAVIFLQPPLAYSTRRVSIAVWLGFRALRRTWPASAWYALVPAILNLAAVTFALRATDWWRILIPGGVAVLNLWLAGAIAALYLRLHEIGDDGAAHAPHGERLDPRSEPRPDA